MKKLSFSLSLALALSAGAQTNNSTVTLGWSYPAAGLSSDLVFLIGSCTNLQVPYTNWYLVGPPVSATNLIALENPTTNAQGFLLFTCQFPCVAQAQYFAAQASNFWGMSATSNWTSTPPMPVTTTNLTLKHP